MTREDFEIGSSSVEEFFGWINERHAIWVKRNRGEAKPWTTDPIFLDWKFTNVFRQLDKGTIWLNRLLKLCDTDDEILRTTLWYRYFNRYEHAEYWIGRGYVPEIDDLEEYVQDLYNKGIPLFTSAHMVCGKPGERKHHTYISATREIMKGADGILHDFTFACTLEGMYRMLIQWPMVGKFVCYELLCDFRFTLLKRVTDTCRWGSVGPGAVRGLKRLGLDPTSESMKHLWQISCNYLSDDVKQVPALFEIREIEHSLCEFDKYIRIQKGIGRPRCRYNGRA